MVEKFEDIFYVDKDKLVKFMTDYYDYYDTTPACDRQTDRPTNRRTDISGKDKTQDSSQMQLQLCPEYTLTNKSFKLYKISSFLNKIMLKIFGHSFFCEHSVVSHSNL